MYGERIQKKVGNINLDAVACAVDDNNIVYTIIYFFTNTKEETISKLSEIYGDYESMFFPIMHGKLRCQTTGNGLFVYPHLKTVSLCMMSYPLMK